MSYLSKIEMSYKRDAILSVDGGQQYGSKGHDYAKAKGFETAPYHSQGDGGGDYAGFSASRLRGA